MRLLTCLLAASLLVCSCRKAPEASASPAEPSATATNIAAPASSTTPGGTASPDATLPEFRPALLGTGTAALINQINVPELIRKGQKDGSVMFYCSVLRTGEPADYKLYRATPGSEPLQDQLATRLETTRFIPAVHDHETVDVIFFGTVTFKITNGKPRLRIFANQEAEELKKETDFISPQPYSGRGSNFEGLHYPNNGVTTVLTGIVDLALKVDATGMLKEARIVREEPPLVGFGRTAAEDFRVSRFIPAFRDGKPVECSITLPVYYEP